MRAGKWKSKDRKTGKKHMNTISEETKELCNEFMQVHKYKYKRLLFFNPDTNKPFTRQGVWKMFKTKAEQINIYAIGAHSTRATSAHKKMLATGDIEQVRKFLLHDNAKVTKTYLKNKRIKRKNCA